MTAVIRWRTYSALLVALLIVTLACQPGDKERTGVPSTEGNGAFVPIQVGDTVPSYRGMSLTGTSIRIGRGEPVTLINVWATWCASCGVELADIGKLAAQFPTLRIIGVSIDEGSQTQVTRFVEEHRLRFPVIHDPTGIITQLYHISGVPETILVDENGRIFWHHTGDIRPVLSEVRSVLEKALH